MIQEGLIWTYYDCSNVCYLFGEYELPCMVMTMSQALFGLAMIMVILFFIRKLIIKVKKELRNGKKS